jgi:type I pantothenate kinase
MDAGQAEGAALSPFVRYSREEWSGLRSTASASLSLSESQARELRHTTTIKRASLEEMSEVYLPLSWLLSLHVDATRKLYQAAHAFLLGKEAEEVPYVIGIAGSVGVGKSTTAEVLQALISLWPGRPKVDLVSTDGFLYPNRVLRSRGLLERKGFPESYDLPLLLRFLADIKSGRAEVSVPIHSHLTYDIIPNQAQIVRHPEILILEGLNILEAGIIVPAERQRVFVSDYFDFSIYVDAEEHFIRQWYLQRFLRLREMALRDESAYMHRYASLSVEETTKEAERIWDEIDHPNLKENIEPTKSRARLILEKGQDHSVQSVLLRKV